MKKLIIFTTILLSNFVFSCGFYPYGEDVRISFLNPQNFNYQKYASFNYSSLYYESQSVYYDFETQPNELLWSKYCNGNVKNEDIRYVLNNLSKEEINLYSKNSFLKYLYQTKDIEAINYLKFAKDCEFFNTWQKDPWERTDYQFLPKRKILIDRAQNMSIKTKNLEIKERYAFLAIRLAFYNRDFDTIKLIYNKNFKNQKNENIISIWALYFRAIAEKKETLKNFYLAQVFAKAPEKRFVSWQNFSKNIPINSVLEFATNNQEKANVFLIYGISNPEKNLSGIKNLYALNPHSDGLSFLLLREVNKIEDWVLTPYYTLFNYSLSGFDDNYWQSKKGDISTLNILNRVEYDRKYASELLSFINSVELSKVENPLFWNVAKAYLLFITKDYDASLKEISLLEKNIKTSTFLYKQIQKIKTLNLFANQTYGNAVIPTKTKGIILSNKKEVKFIFALGRELEYLGNTDDAALLYASLSSVSKVNDIFVPYKSVKNKNQTFEDYYSDYYSYLDAVYSPEQLSSFILKLKSENDFDKRMIQMSTKEINKLQDLLGTKYLRQNKLHLALQEFQKLDKDYLDSQYSLWERTDHTYGSLVFKHNPFYELKYTPEFIEKRDNFRLNKVSITKKLIEFINRANNLNEPNRDYYYFLVANCYYNMTEKGNAWMMKRNYLSGKNFTIVEDNEEFNSANLAKYYYNKAFENAKTNKFKALCVKMLGMCEDSKIDFEITSKYNYYEFPENYFAYKFQRNKFYQNLKTNYSDDYENLMSNCDSFREYFASRR